MTASILDTIRVADFTRIFAGPIATQVLGDMGADVIKIERIEGGDEVRSYGQPPEGGDKGPAFLAYNRNKRSIAIDLKSKEGIDVIERLVESCDVIVENFRSGVMEKLGLDYASLSKRRPDLIYCSVTGFGSSGPLAKKAANDLIMQAYGGLISVTGQSGSEPARAGTAVADLSAGLYAAIGILGALYHRKNTGVGQLVETSMLEAQSSMMGHMFSEYWQTGYVPGPMGTSNRLGLPNEAYRTSDGLIVIAATSDRMWRRCCKALGVPELAQDRRFATLAARNLNRAPLLQSLGEIVRRLTTKDCIAALEGAGVSCSEVRDIAQVAADEQLARLGAVKSIVGDLGKPARIIGNPLHFAGATSDDVRLSPPRIGEHTREILRELRYPANEIESMIATRVVAEPA